MQIYLIKSLSFSSQQYGTKFTFFEESSKLLTLCQIEIQIFQQFGFEFLTFAHQLRKLSQQSHKGSKTIFPSVLSLLEK